MKIFAIREDQHRKNAGYIDAEHKWSLPGVICPSCGQTWSTVGMEYPSVDLSQFPDEELYREARPESFHEYRSLRQKIADRFPNLPVLKPGTEFGSLRGRSFGKPDGFVWRAWWTICLESSALEKLRNSDLLLPNSVKAELKFKKEVQEVFELDLPMRANLVNGVYDDNELKYCMMCQRDSAKLPEEICIDWASIPSDFDIFRVANFPTIILATEKFVATVTNLDIKGVVFEKVKTT